MRIRSVNLASLLWIAVVSAVMGGFLSCSEADNSLPSVSVKELVTDPTAYSGRVALTGVVQAVNEQNRMMRVIDHEEYLTCGLNPCAAAGILNLYTPDEARPLGSTPNDLVYQGSFPAVADKVRIEGEIRLTPQGYVFEVHRILKKSREIMSRV